MSSVKVVNKAVQYILTGPALHAVNNLENLDFARITNQEIDIEETQMSIRLSPMSVNIIKFRAEEPIE